MDFSKVRLNCSQLGAVMSEPKGNLTDLMFERLEKLKSKTELTPKQELERIELQFRMDNYDPLALSKGCMSYLMFLYSYLKYGRQHKLKAGTGIAQLIKGSKMEKKSFEIIKRLTGLNFHRYKKNLKTDYLRGNLDVINAEFLEDATKIIDIKTSFSQFHFMKSATSEIARADNFQMQGYLALTGKDQGEVYHCLTDFTEEVIKEQRNQMIQLLCPDGVITEQFEEEWEMAENSMRFGHIPDEERVIFHPVERDDKIIGKIYEKVEFCREWLAEFESKHHNKVADQLAEWQRQLSLESPRELG